MTKKEKEGRVDTPPTYDTTTGVPSYTNGSAAAAVAAASSGGSPGSEIKDAAALNLEGDVGAASDAAVHSLFIRPIAEPGSGKAATAIPSVYIACEWSVAHGCFIGTPCARDAARQANGDLDVFALLTIIATGLLRTPGGLVRMSGRVRVFGEDVP